MIYKIVANFVMYQLFALKNFCEQVIMVLHDKGESKIHQVLE